MIMEGMVAAPMRDDLYAFCSWKWGMLLMTFFFSTLLFHTLTVPTYDFHSLQFCPLLLFLRVIILKSLILEALAHTPTTA